MTDETSTWKRHIWSEERVAHLPNAICDDITINVSLIQHFMSIQIITYLKTAEIYTLHVVAIPAGVQRQVWFIPLANECGVCR